MQRMFRRRCKSILAVLLALLMALPLQSIAALGGGCAGSTVASAHDHEDDSAADTGNHDHAVHGHDDQVDHEGDASGCAHCAPCCLGAALVDSRTLPSVARDHSIIAPAPLTRFVSTFPTRLERPPRALLA